MTGGVVPRHGRACGVRVLIRFFFGNSILLTVFNYTINIINGTEVVMKVQPHFKEEGIHDTPLGIR